MVSSLTTSNQQLATHATVADWVNAMRQIAPEGAAEPWDNVGLTVGDPAAAVTRILLTIDYTPEVAAEARELNCDAVVAYHPPIFAPMKQFVAGSSVFEAARDGIAIYSPHTALDAAPGGTYDVLADALGLTRRRALKPSAAAPTHAKLVTFVPSEAEQKVRAALFSSGGGAGEIGRYTECSFTSSGNGTFRPGTGAQPAIGSVGSLELVSESRIEMLIPLSRVSEITAAVRAAHPYEEPAFDLIPLLPEPSNAGMGRVGEFDVPVSVGVLVDRLKQNLSLNHVLVAGPSDRTIKTAAVCAGSCGSLVDDAICVGAQLMLTGELRHHDALKASAADMTVICTLHSNSERAVLAVVQRRLTELLPGIEVRISQRDRDPFSIR